MEKRSKLRKSPQIILSDEEAETVFHVAADILEKISEYPAHIIKEIIKCVKEGIK